MIGTAWWQYVFIRLCILLLQYFVPLAALLCAVLFFVSPLGDTIPRLVVAWAVSEILFFLLVFLPRYLILQRDALHPSPLPRKDRQRLFRLCFESVPDPEVYLKGWFKGASASEIRRENVKEFLCWSFLNKRDYGLLDDQELEDYTLQLEKLLGRNLPPGKGNATALRLTLDRVSMLHRPLIWYLLCVFTVDALAHFCLRFQSFHFYRLPLKRFATVFPPRPLTLLTTHVTPATTVSYWHRPHKSKSRLPILFVHGIGIGLFTYASFLTQLNRHKDDIVDGETGVLAIEIMPISFRLTHASLDRDEMKAEILKIVLSHGWSKFVLVAHSYGSVIATHLLHDENTSSMIDSVLLVDPVSILLHLPDVAYNFTCRQPAEANEHQLYYFASMDMGVAHTLSRRFFWQDNILWRHDLEGRRVTVVLAGRDLIVNTQAVGQYLAGGEDETTKTSSWKCREWRGTGLDIIWHENLDHAQVFEKKPDYGQLVEVTRQYTMPLRPAHTKQRASRACETCHARKVRCDAANLGVPCTNCVAFSIECRIPAPKRKKAQGKAKDSDSDRGESIQANSPTVDGPGPAGYDFPNHEPQAANHDGMPVTTLSKAQSVQQATQDTHYAHFMKPKFARAPIKEAGRVAYLGESSNLSLLVHDRHGTTDVVHYPLPDTVKGSGAQLTDLDSIEIDILHQRGAFLLPPRALCDELISSFFRWVAPVVPVINQSRFMQRYHDPENPPSLLLLQAMLLAGSRVCTNPQLMDANGSTTPAAMTFYKRAKALYDANYEDDRVTIVQALVLMGWYWEGPEDVTKNVFYWTRVATIVAQGSGMHRSVEGSQLTRPDKRLWKRIWWTLFTRDRSVAVALGRPVHINTDDSDVEMVCEDDFIEDEDNEQSKQQAKHTPNPVHVQFFLQYVRLCEIMGLVLAQQYSVASKARRQNAIDLTHSDMALADWLQNCPKEVYWEPQRHHFWSALLHSNYYTTLCLLHRAHMPPATQEGNGPGSNFPTDAAYPSRNIAFQAAGMITQIIENLQAHDELKFTPAFIVYSLFSALIMHVYQMRSSVPSIVTATQERMQVCMNALKEVSKVWLVAKMVHTLFESILGNKTLEDRLQKAAGKKHKKPRIDGPPISEKEEQPIKRKYDDMEIGFSNGPPVPQVSFERSRPQTPAVTPSRDLGQSAPVASMAAPSSSPHMRHSNDAFLGTSRGNTRPPTPFNPSYSIPATPPDLFLVTRDSPHISQSLWENFQPDQLFPDGTNMSMPQFNGQQALDPQLQMPQLQSPAMLQPPMQSQQLPPRAMSGAQEGHGNVQGLQDVSGLPHMQGMQQPSSSHGWPNEFHPDAQVPEDPWTSNSRNKGPVAPTTLNVEDWFQFFGINGDWGGLNPDGI
ncbi:MAG: hypothetical protein Q9213_001595 [Squamulea squamosa]